jgi:hypothetical protein
MPKKTKSNAFGATENLWETPVAKAPDWRAKPGFDPAGVKGPKGGKPAKAVIKCPALPRRVQGH